MIQAIPFIKNISRLLSIFRILIKYRLDELLGNTVLKTYLRYLVILTPLVKRIPKDSLSRGERLRIALEELGPIFIKMGQLLSTRLDLLPEDIALALIPLQDKVPPFDSQLAIKIITETLTEPIENVFAEFDAIPLASASIAQVHAATLLNGDKVIIKLLRPNIAHSIQQDVAWLKLISRLLHHYWPLSRQFKPIEVIEEFQKTLTDELDLMREAANASMLKRNFIDSSLLYVPTIYWEYCKPTMIVMERIYGTTISDIAYFKSQGTNFKTLSERGVEIFFIQVFQHCFFHADMHPGNIFVCVKNPENPKYMAVDFGIMGTLSPFDQRYLAENLLAFFSRDYRKVAQLHVESGWVPYDTRVDEFEAAIRTVCEPIFARPLKEISFGKTLLRLFETARRFNMAVQPQLILLQKTLISVEGLGRQLYPELDLWNTAKPFLENWMQEQMGWRAFCNRVRKNSPYWLEKLPTVPHLIYKFLESNQLKQITPIDKAPPRTVRSGLKENFWFGLTCGSLILLLLQRLDFLIF